MTGSVTPPAADAPPPEGAGRAAPDAARPAALDAPGRLAALRATGLADGAPSAVFDRLARAAARLLGVPVALVSLVDDRRQHFAGLAGLTGWAADARATPLTHSFCQHVVTRGAPLVVPDASADPLVRHNRAVDELRVRAYLGVPLAAASGETLGALCAIDTAPRAWTADDVEVLGDLAHAAAAELELRLALAAARESEARYRAAIELNPQIPWVADARGRVVELSPRWLAFTGLSPEASVGAGWLDAVHPEDRPGVAEAFARAVASGEPLDVEHRLRTARGDACWVRTRARPQRDDAGRPVRWFGWSDDIHDRVLAEQEQARFALVARAGVDGLWSWDVRTDAVFHSPRFRELLGYTAEGYGDNRAAFFARLHPDDHARVRAAVRAHLETRAPYDLEVRLRHADGAWRWCWIRGQAEWGADGRPLRMAGSLSDVTARHDAEAALRASDARYRALLRQYPDGAVFLMGQDRRLVVADGEALATAGVDAAALPGRTPAEVLAPADAATAAPYYEAALAGEERRFTLVHGGRTYEGRALPLRDANGRVDGAMIVSRDVSERAAQAAALRASEERYALAARATRNAIWDWDLGTDALSWSNGVTSIFGYAPAEVPQGAPGGIAWWTDRIHPDDRGRVVASIREAAAGGGAGAWQEEYRFRRADGTDAAVVDRGFVARDAAGRAVRMVGAMEDVTAQRELEGRLRQAQRMEAVGQLAGGVAHDFNNLLTVITGNLEFAAADLPPALPADHPVRTDLAEVGEAAERARALVRQLLAFSRKQPARPTRLRIGDAVAQAERLLRRVIGEEIVLAVEVATPEARVDVDAGELEQVLLNLAVNARDAMLTPRHGHPGRGGTFELEVDAVADAGADGPPGAAPGAAPGGWVRIRARDTGHGMDAATQARAFEPFFTTKPVGQGTGLGLATVFGIVRQAGGAVRVDSAPGRGTTFTILLPAAEPDDADALRAAEPPPPPADRGTLLLVEDEAPVRATARRLLERRGYAVLEARHGADALLVWREHGGRVDAVITDLRMPELGGRELVARLRADRPGLPAVFVSGYAERSATPPAAPGEAFVDKPFTGAALAAAVRQVLEAARAGNA